MTEIKEDGKMVELKNKAEECDRLLLQIDELQKKSDALRADILAGITDTKLTSITVDNGDMFELQTKTKYSYSDETAMIAWLKSNGYGKYVKEKISVSPFNTAFKSGKDMKLTESMNPMMKATTTQELHFVAKKQK